MAEDRGFLAAAQPVVTGLHVDAPPARQIIGGSQLVKHDRVVAQRRPDHPVTPLDQYRHHKVSEASRVKGRRPGMHGLVATHRGTTAEVDTYICMRTPPPRRPMRSLIVPGMIAPQLGSLDPALG